MNFVSAQAETSTQHVTSNRHQVPTLPLDPVMDASLCLILSKKLTTSLNVSNPLLVNKFNSDAKEEDISLGSNVSAMRNSQQSFIPI